MFTNVYGGESEFVSIDNGGLIGIVVIDAVGGSGGAGRVEDLLIFLVPSLFDRSVSPMTMNTMTTMISHLLARYVKSFFEKV